jgi:hypothetical protein
MQILLEKTEQLQEYKFNFNEIKNDLILQLEKFNNLVVTDDAIKEAKASRADLNKLKKEISDKVSEIKKEHNKPFDLFKKQTDELIELINKPVFAIDAQIKSYEQKLKDEKLLQIKDFWNESSLWSEEVISFNKIFQDKWLNASESMNKVKTEITNLIVRISSDIDIIKAFNSPFESALMDIYLRHFDVSTTMREKANFDKREAERQEQLRKQSYKKCCECGIELSEGFWQELNGNIFCPDHWFLENEKLQKQAAIEDTPTQVLENNNCITETMSDTSEQPIEEEIRRQIKLCLYLTQEEERELLRCLQDSGIEYSYITEKTDELIGKDEIPF